MKKIALIATILLFTATAFGATVKLAWDPNSETDLAGYRVFFKNYGQAYDYSKPIWEGPETTCTVEIDQTGDFVVRALNVAGAESGDSNEVSQSITPAAPQNLLKEAIDLAIRSLEKFKEYVSLVDTPAKQ
jgi:hypothetical protein